MKIKILFILSVYCVASYISAQTSLNQNYKKWWDDWYASGHNSGPGSRGFLAQHKADVMNEFIKKNNIQSVIEFGCGDGYNLSLISYKEYLGLDVSKFSVQMCQEIYKNDPTKSFRLYDPSSFTNGGFKKVDLVVCLDVLYHVLDEQEYIKTLDDIFSFDAPYVVLYSTLTEKWNGGYSEIYHRDLLKYLTKYPQYTIEIRENKYKYVEGGSTADWVFLTRKN